MTKLLPLALVLALAACTTQTPAQQQQEQAQQQQQQHLQQEDSDRKNTAKDNAEVNWMLIGISTGKYSEQITTAVFKTLQECEQAANEEANACTPIAALPASYWKK